MFTPSSSKQIPRQQCKNVVESSSLSYTRRSQPNTPEDAIRRYLANFEHFIPGNDKWKNRLKPDIEAKVFHLRKRHPNFYRTKLSRYINEACDELLSIVSAAYESDKKPEDMAKCIYNQVHKDFTRILIAFQHSVPKGEISFQKERDRLTLIDMLFNQQKELRQQISELQASEFGLDELPEEGADEDPESYETLYDRISKLSRKLHDVSVRIAALEDDPIEEEVEFKLMVPKNSMLNRLDEPQLDRLEQLLHDFAIQQKNKTTMNKTIIDGMIDLLGFDKSTISKEDLNVMARDALDAYTQYFRQQADQRRHDLYEELLNNDTLKPREGLIFKNPDDISDEARTELDRTDAMFKQKLEDCLEVHAKRQSNDKNEVQVEDDIEDMIDTSQETRELLTKVKNSDPLFNQTRVKEEQVDPYDLELEEEEEEEEDGDYEMDDDHEDTSIKQEGAEIPSKNPVRSASLERYDIPQQRQQQQGPIMPKEVKSTLVSDNRTPVSSQSTQSKRGYESDDEIEFIGVVEPSPKIGYVPPKPVSLLKRTNSPITMATPKKVQQNIGTPVQQQQKQSKHHQVQRQSQEKLKKEKNASPPITKTPCGSQQGSTTPKKDKNASVPIHKAPSNSLNTQVSQGNESDDDIEFIGVVEPSAKIAQVSLD